MTKAQRQAAWLTEFCSLLLAQHPRLSGRVEWPAALHYFFGGITPAEAVEQYCLARNIEEPAA